MQNQFVPIVTSCLTLLGSVIGSTSAIANESPDAAASLEHVTVYGTSNALPVLEYPGQVSVVDKEEIDLFNPSSMSDLLRNVPGLEFSGGPRRTGETPSIRGRGGENVLILLDGARQSFISAHDGRFFLDPELLRSAEVVKGPASALYGSGAVGGVLAFESVDAADLLLPNETAGMRARLGFQGVNQETLISTTGYVMTDQLDALASVNVRQSGDIALGSGADLPSDDELLSGLLKLTYKISDELSVQGSWQHFSNDAFEPNNGQGLNIADSESVVNVEKQIQTDTWRAGVSFAPANQSLLDLSLTVYQTNSEVEEFDQSLPRITLREIETKGISARNVSQFDLDNINLQFTVGADWYKDAQTGTDDNVQSGLRGGVPNAEAQFTGLFAQLEMRIEQPLGLPGEVLIIPGVRYDRFTTEADDLEVNKIEDNELTPRLAVSYSPNDWLSLFASYAQGFRAPSVNELYLDGVHFSLPHPILFDPQNGQNVFINNNFIANPELKPESSESQEVGFSLDFNGLLVTGDVWQSKVSYYQSDIRDLIDLQVDFAFDPSCFNPPFLPCSAGTSSSANVDSATINGVELESRYENSHIAINLTYSVIDGEDDTTGIDLGTLTPDRLNLDIRYKADSINAQLGARWQLARRFERRIYDESNDVFTISESRSGYGVLDIYASWSPVENVYLTAGVDNLFDRDYDRVFEDVSATGRNMKLSVAWNQNF
jgi:hemoglobin/transferrin/lactoferrin receptor protein